MVKPAVSYNGEDLPEHIPDDEGAGISQKQFASQNSMNSDKIENKAEYGNQTEVVVDGIHAEICHCCGCIKRSETFRQDLQMHMWIY